MRFFCSHQVVCACHAVYVVSLCSGRCSSYLQALLELGVPMIFAAVKLGIPQQSIMTSSLAFVLLWRWPCLVNLLLPRIAVDGILYLKTSDMDLLCLAVFYGDSCRDDYELLVGAAFRFLGADSVSFCREDVCSACMSMSFTELPFEINVAMV